jgi:PhnB protein
MKQSFGGQEIQRTTRPDGTIMHAEVKIGDSVVMIAEASAEVPAMPCMLHVYVPDCEAAYARALRLGATALREPARQFYGDRSGGVRDVGGNTWWIATHEEDVSAEEIERRARTTSQS